MRDGERHKLSEGWTDRRVNRLKAMFAEGRSQSEIARSLGGVSREAVGNKIDRLQRAGKLPMRSAPKPPEITTATRPLSARVQPTGERTPRGAGILFRTISEEEMKAKGADGQVKNARIEASMPVTGGTVLASELKRGQCAYPFGELTACGRQTVTNKGRLSNYCGTCFRRMYGKDAT